LLYCLVAFSGAWAEPPPAVDVTIHGVQPRRILSIDWNPVSLIFGKVSGSVVIAPVNHHALALSPSYASTQTAPIYVFDAAGNPTQLPVQKFNSIGGELGYRYYFGERGPRGLFLGPSLLLFSVTATAQNGTQTAFHNYGLAGDVGYQMLVAERVSLSLGAGLQYTWDSKSIPAQQFPSDLYANGGFRPRVIAALGVAF
jgi:hypothetical protein